MLITSKNDNYNYTKIIDRIVELLENNGFQVDKDMTNKYLRTKERRSPKYSTTESR
jgi:hypothetical protein